MESLIQEYENLLCGIFCIIVGVLCYVFMKYQKKTETKEDRESMSLYDESVDFGVYFMGGVGILVGIYILLQELF